MKTPRACCSRRLRQEFLTSQTFNDKIRRERNRQTGPSSVLLGSTEGEPRGRRQERYLVHVQKWISQNLPASWVAYVVDFSFQKLNSIIVIVIYAMMLAITYSKKKYNSKVICIKFIHLQNGMNMFTLTYTQNQAKHEFWKLHIFGQNLTY